MNFALVLMLLFALTANAQKVSSADSDKGVIAPTQYTSADTLRALQRLFKSHRTLGAVLVGASSAIIVASIISVNSGPDSLAPTGVEGTVIATGITGIGTALLWVPGIGQLAGYSKKKEQAIIAEFIAKHTLPQKIQRRLKPSLFASR